LELAASDAQQFGIQLIGGISTGKTTYLAAFWHEYLSRSKLLKTFLLLQFQRAICGIEVLVSKR